MRPRPTLAHASTHTLLWTYIYLTLHALTPTPAPAPTPDLPTNLPTILVQMDDPFPCLDIRSRTRERQACAHLACICSPTHPSSP